MSGYPARPEDDYYPVPVLRPEDPTPTDDRHLLGAAGDGCMALASVALIVMALMYLAVHIVLAVFN